MGKKKQYLPGRRWNVTCHSSCGLSVHDFLPDIHDGREKTVQHYLWREVITALQASKYQSQEPCDVMEITCVPYCNMMRTSLCLWSLPPSM